MKKKLSLPLVLIAFVLFLNTLSAQKEAALRTGVDKILQEKFKKDGPGGAVLVAEKDQILYQTALGMANLEQNVPLRADHVFRIGSVSKHFTAAAILRLSEHGKLDLQDDITRFIPDYPTHDLKITVEHLLTHTSGIKSYTSMETWDDQVHRKDFTPVELIAYFKDEPMDFEPNTQWEYNNSGYILLGYIIEVVSGKPYEDYITEEFFAPLGMKNSYYGNVTPLIKNRANGYSENERTGAYENAAYLSMTQPYAAGSLMSTVEDLFIWTRALHTGKVVKPETFKKAITPYVLPDGTNTLYGYGLEIKSMLGSLSIEHGGGIHGFLSDLMYLPEEEICVAVLTNCDCVSPGNITERVAALALGKDYQPAAITLTTQELEPYIGVYKNGKREIRYIRLEEGKLTSQRKGGSKFTLLPFSENEFFFQNSSARIAFEKETNYDIPIMVAYVSDRSASIDRWVRSSQPLPAERAEILLTKAQMQPFVGEYELMPGFNITVALEGMQLVCQATGQPSFEVFALSETRFFLKEVDAEIEFYPNPDGSVPKMVLFQAGQEIPGKRVK